MHGRVYLYTFGARRCNVLSISELICDLEMDISVRQQDRVVLVCCVWFVLFCFLKGQSWY